MDYADPRGARGLQGNARVLTRNRTASCIAPDRFHPGGPLRAAPTQGARAWERSGKGTRTAGYADPVRDDGGRTVALPAGQPGGALVADMPVRAGHAGRPGSGLCHQRRTRRPKPPWPIAEIRIRATPLRQASGLDLNRAWLGRPPRPPSQDRYDVASRLGSDCTGSMIGRRGGTGEAISGPSGKSPDDAGDLSSRSTWGETEWGLTSRDRTDARRIPEKPR